jgi:glycosyltransferase involved in cell wall biosynthesis
MSPLISILVPAYNRADYLPACLDSVLGQPFADFEIICSDNASTDGTWEVLRRYAARDSRVRILRNAENLGAVPNWERCLAAARGHFVHWLWSDDWIEPDFYQYLLARMKTSAAEMAVAPAFFALSSGFRPIEYSILNEVVGGPDFGRRVLLSDRVSRSPANALIPADLVRKHFYTNIPRSGKLDPVRRAIGPDSLMIAGAALESRQVAISDRPLVNFRHHAGSISTQTRELESLYLYAHLWFARRAGVHFRGAERVRLLRLALAAETVARKQALLWAWVQAL